MGSKGGATTTTNNNAVSYYTPSPQIAASGNTALSMAQGAAGQPFQTPQAPVAGLTPDQLAAFTNFRQAPGMAQPYFDIASRLAQHSATPITGDDIGQYYNPFAANVFAAQDDLFGQQRRNTTGQLTQAAGGVGADRIAVGQSELARQQGLARGETASNLWGQALGAAQQGRGREAQAAYAMGSFGPAALQSYLAGTGAMLSGGNQQQVQEQRQLDAPYQNTLQRLAYPFQTAQYLAGITGGLAPALGGTTTQWGSGSQTQPPPSIWSQIAGGAGLGLVAANSMFGSGSGSYSGGFNPNNGGAYFLDGSNFTPGFARGGALGENPFALDSSIVPDLALQPGTGQRPMLPGQTTTKTGGGGDNTLQTLGNVAKLAMMFIATGGAIPANPFAPVSRADGGGLDFADRWAPAADAVGTGVFDVGGGNYSSALERPFGAAPDVPMPLPRPNIPVLPGSQPMPSSPWAKVAASDVPMRGNPPPMPGAMAFSGGEDDALPAGAAPVAGAATFPGMDPAGGLMPQLPRSQMPYPNATQDNAGSQFAKSPWAALAAASLATLAGTSPHAAVNIGKGGLEGLKHLEQQRKDSREEETINQRAQQLWQDAQKHLDQYRRPTAGEALRDKRAREHLEFEREKLAQENWVATGATDVYGRPLLYNRKTGETKVAAPKDGAGAAADGSAAAPVDAASTYSWAKENPNDPAASKLLGDAERYLKTGTLPPNMGRGVQGQAESSRIRSMAYQMAAERGIKAEDLPKLWQAFKSEQVNITRFMGGPQGNVTRALNVVVDHLSTFRELGRALDNGNIRAFNQIAQTWAEQTGNPQPTNFDMAKQIVGTEIIKALGVAGAGTEKERAELGSRISRAASWKQIEGAVDDVVKPLLAGQLRGMRKQFVAATGLPESKYNEQLFPETLKFLEAGEGSSKKELSGQDKRALDWANANPNDPRAAAIKKKLGVQ